MLSLLVLLTSAFAQDDDLDFEDEPSGPIGVPIVHGLSDDDPFEFDTEPEPPPPPPPSPVPDVGDRTPFGGGYPLVVEPAGDAVLVGLPVLVSLDRPAATTIVTAEFLVAGSKASTTQVTVEPAGHRAGAPTFVWVRALVPVTPGADLAVVIKQGAGKTAVEKFRETATAP